MSKQNLRDIGETELLLRYMGIKRPSSGGDAAGKPLALELSRRLCDRVDAEAMSPYDLAAASGLSCGVVEKALKGSHLTHPDTFQQLLYAARRGLGA